MVMSMHLYQPVEDPRSLRPELSEGLGHVLRKMMAKVSGDRYPDADAVDRDLYLVEIGQVPEAASAPIDVDSELTLGSPSAAKNL